MNGTPWKVGKRDFVVRSLVVVAEHPAELVAIAVRAEHLQLVRLLVDLVVVLSIRQEDPRVGVELDHHAPCLAAGRRPARET